MTRTFLFAASAALAACSQQQEAPVDNSAANVAVTNAVTGNAAAEAVPAGFQINETSWTYRRNGQDIQESIDSSGNYIANSGDTHVDHGTVVMKDGKACFTSAMNQDGELCWTTSPVEVGQSFETTSDKGEKLTVTRVAYVPLSMPS